MCELAKLELNELNDAKVLDDVCVGKGGLDWELEGERERASAGSTDLGLVGAHIAVFEAVVVAISYEKAISQQIACGESKLKLDLMLRGNQPAEECRGSGVKEGSGRERGSNVNCGIQASLIILPTHWFVYYSCKEEPGLRFSKQIASTTTG